MKEISISQELEQQESKLRAMMFILKSVMNSLSYISEWELTNLSTSYILDWQVRFNSAVLALKKQVDDMHMERMNKMHEIMNEVDQEMSSIKKEREEKILQFANKQLDRAASK